MIKFDSYVKEHLSRLELDPYGEEDWDDDKSNIYVHMTRTLGGDMWYFQISVIKGFIKINQYRNKILKPGNKLIRTLIEISDIDEVNIRNFFREGDCLKFNRNIPEQDIINVVDRIYNNLYPEYKKNLDKVLNQVQTDINRLENKQNIKWNI